MLSGVFKNCYGIKEFVMQAINFNICNKAVIYAPNGVMKSSFSKVFDDISHGIKTIDRVFAENETSYIIKYYDKEYKYNSNNPEKISQADNIYVINTFVESFEFTRENVGVLLADNETRKKYDDCMNIINQDIAEVIENICELSGISSKNIRDIIINDLKLSKDSDWTNIFEKIKQLMVTKKEYNFLKFCKYTDLINDKTMQIYSSNEFKSYISEYIKKLNKLLKKNTILSKSFTDCSAENFGKALSDNNFFKAKHMIYLKDGKTIIRSIKKWNAMVDEQLNIIYNNNDLNKEFNKLKKLFNKNYNSIKLRNIISKHPTIIPCLFDIDQLKIQIWLYLFSSMNQQFDYYYQKYQNIRKK